MTDLMLFLYMAKVSILKWKGPEERMEKNKRQSYYLKAVICAAILIGLDQAVKYLVVLNLKGNPPIDIIKNVFQLAYLENRGAAFGILENKRIFFYLCAVVILIVVAYFYTKVPMEKKFLPLRICAIFIASGAIGNVIDRVRLNYVVDFLYFKLIDFPIFNVADIYVTFAAVMLVFLVCFYYNEEDLERVFSHS